VTEKKVDILKEIKKAVVITSEQIDEIDVDVVELCKQFLNTLEDMVESSEDDRVRISAINAFFDNSSKLHTITTQIAIRTAEKLKNLQIINNLESPVQEVIEFTDSPVVVDEPRLRREGAEIERKKILLHLIDGIDKYQKRQLKKYSKFENKTSETVLRLTVEEVTKLITDVTELKHGKEVK